MKLSFPQLFALCGLGMFSVDPTVHAQSVMTQFELVATPGRIDFGMVEIGDERVERVVIRNKSRSPDPVRDIELEIANRVKSSFRLVGVRCPRSLSPGATCIASVSFSPQKAGRTRDRVSVMSPSTRTLSIELRGTGGER